MQGGLFLDEDDCEVRETLEHVTNYAFDTADEARDWLSQRLAEMRAALLNRPKH